MGALLTLLLAGACSRTEHTPEALMKTGLDALYSKGDPESAVKAFRKVLDKNPNHYGANFQLGMALDRAGRPGEARPVWEKVLTMAEGLRDEKTVDHARKRLGRPSATPEDAAMKGGLDALYGKRDAPIAILEFRKVLGMNPNHYGANFQLAMALDQAGKPAEARPQWEKVLGMAEGLKDAKTTTWVKERLARRP